MPEAEARHSGCVKLSEEVRLMDWPVGYDGADIQVWADSTASTYWWPLLGSSLEVRRQS